MKIVVPELGESIVEATVARWLRSEGDYVEAGDPLVELETDKVNVEVSAERAGRIDKIFKRDGADVRVGEEIGLIDDTAADAKPGPSRPAPEPAEQPAAFSPSTETPSRAAGRTAQALPPDVEEKLASIEPLAPRLSSPESRGQLSGGLNWGSGGAPLPAQESPRGARREERVRLSRRRRTIAERLVAAQTTAAMLTTFNEIDMSAIAGMRRSHKETFKERHGVNLGILSFFVKATVGALKAFPELNSQLDGDDLVIKHHYDIGVAIGSAEGLLVPVLRDADRLTFARIEGAVKDFARRSESGSLSLEELRGGTFTITNGGIFGSLLSTPILNFPEVGILGLHKVEERPVAVDGQVVVRPMMYIALTYDHRVVDGREAVGFLSKVKELAEDPGALLLES